MKNYAIAGVCFLVASCTFPLTNTANDAYVLFVGPSQSQAQFYENLGKRLNDTDSLKANFLVLGAVSPAVDSNFAPSDSGTLFQFLSKGLPDRFQNPGNFIFVMPDVEVDTTGWSDWAATLNNSSGPCAFDPSHPLVSYPTSKNAVQADQAKELVASICWATSMNHALTQPLIDGLSYDGQSNIMSSTPDNLTWLKATLTAYHQQDAMVPAYLGWVHGGVSAGVDVSFVEMYDLYRGSVPHLRLSEVAQEGVSTDYDLVSSGSSCEEGSSCGTPAGDIFPGMQYVFETINPHNQKPMEEGEMGASIASCAWAFVNPDSQNAQEIQSDCDVYAKHIDTTQPLSQQALNAYAYLFLGPFQTPSQIQVEKLAGIWPSPSAGSQGGLPSVVFLFSTQYFGPERSDTPVPESCVLNELSSSSACGAENGFGVWQGQTGLQAFKNFTHQFLYYAQGCQDEASCHFDGYSGVYMYDFVPLSWYQTNGS